METDSSFISDKTPEYNVEGAPLRIHTLDIVALAEYLYSKKIRTTQGKLICPLHPGHIEVLKDDARFKVLACGRRWGKCADLQEILYLADGSIHKIEDLIGKTFEVYSVDKNFNIIKTLASCVDNGEKPVYKITTKYGLELLRTENHPLFTSLGWGTIEDSGLKVGIKIAVPNCLPQEGTIEKDPVKIELLAYLLGDGCLTQNEYSFTVANPIIEERFRSLLDGTTRTTQKLGNKAVDIHLHKNNSIYDLIEELGLKGKNSYTKFIPNWVFTSPNNQIALFLNRLFSTDGWICRGEIGYCSASKPIVVAVKHLLARLNIISNIYKKTLRSGPYIGNEYYQLCILNFTEQKKFIEKVGILGKEDKYAYLFSYSKNSFNTQIDTLPKEFCKLFANKLKKLKSYREQEIELGRVRPDRAVGKETVRYYANLYSKKFEEELKIINSDFYWDEITSIEFLGNRPTAGLIVPFYNNYINDCLEHNTLLTSLMALSVLMQQNRRVWCIAPDYSLCEKVFRELYSILVTQLKLIEPGKKGRARAQKGDYFLETPWGSVFEAKSLERPDSLAGDALDLAIVDEAALCPNIDQIWTQMIRPTLIDKEGSAIFISTPRSRNGFYKLYLQGEKGLKQKEGKLAIGKELGVSDDMRDWSSFKKTSYDNPMIAATPEKSKEEIDSAKRESVLAGKYLKFRQEYLADFEANSDIVFPGYIEDPSDKIEFPNVIDYIWHPDEGPSYVACDHNFARPASTLFAQVNKYNDIVIFDELFTPHTTAYMQGQQILEKEKELTRKLWEADQRKNDLYEP